MSDVQFSRGDVERVAQKLDGLRPQFTEHDWILLSAIFAAATEVAGRSGAERAAAGAAETDGGASLHAGPLGTFTPGEEEAEPGTIPDKITRPSLHDQVLHSFNAGAEDEAGVAPARSASDEER